jgi:hypothetical protein
MTSRLFGFVCDDIASLKDENKRNKVIDIAKEYDLDLSIWDGTSFICQYPAPEKDDDSDPQYWLNQLRDKGVNLLRGLIQFGANSRDHPFGYEIWDGYCLAYKLRDIGFKIDFNKLPTATSIHGDSYEKIEVHYIAFEF